MTIKISGLGNLTAVYGNTIIPVVANIAGTLTTVKGNLDQFGTYINRAELPYGNIIPFADAVYSLGTPSYRFKDLYLLGTTIFLGNANISVSNAAVTTSLPFTAATVNATNLNVGANVSANNISVSGEITATDVTTGTVSAGDITSSGTVQAANISATVTLSAANLSVSGDLSVSNLEVSGNTITLGSATLNVAGGTLQSSVPIEAAITSTSNLTVQGARIEFAQGAYVVEEEVAGSPGQYALTLTSAEDGIVGLNALDSNAIVSSSVIVSNVSVQLNVANVDPGVGNVNVWLYDSIGGLFFPDGTRQDTAYDVSVNYSNAKVATYLTSQNIASYSNVNVQTYLTNSWSGTIAGNTLMTGAFGVSNVFVPTAANSAGIAGTLVWDSNYLYVCVGTNTWKRANIATW